MSVDTASRLRQFLTGRLRVEDVLLFAWLVLRPLVVPEHPSGAALPGFDPLGGVLDLVALCGAAASLVARRADSTHTGLIRDDDVAYTVGPLFGAVAFAVADCANRLGLSGGASAIPLVLPIVAGVVARLRLPPTTAPTRRALVTPFILATSGFFGDFLAGLTQIFDLRYLAASLGGSQLPEALFVLGIGTVAIAIFYLMLVFAPRQIAEREGTGGSWAIRFVVFLVGLSLGTTLASILHG